MLVLRGPQGRLVIPTESPSLNKVFTYLLYLSMSTLVKLPHCWKITSHGSNLLKATVPHGEISTLLIKAYAQNPNSAGQEDRTCVSRICSSDSPGVRYWKM